MAPALKGPIRPLVIREIVVTLAEFLIYLLQAHGETLKRLAALLGEDNLVSVLELAGERDATRDGTTGVPASPSFNFGLFEDSAGTLPSCDPAYRELEGAVHDLQLPAPLEFHLWAYPSYRALIESPLELTTRIPGPGGDAGIELVDVAIAQAQAWVEQLGLPEPFSSQARRAAHVPWLRFRTQALKRIGKRPIGPVY